MTPFLGSWTSNGNQIEYCAGASHTDTGMLGITITAGSAPGQIVTQPVGYCALTWNVSGSAAALVASTTCGTVAGSVGGTWTPTFETGSLTLTGTTITAADTGSAVYVNGTTESCTFTQSSTYTKD